MAEKRNVNEPGRLKAPNILKLVFLTLLLATLTYIGSYVYFMTRPASNEDKLTDQLSTISIAGTKLFPALKNYSLDQIDGREPILKGWLTRTPQLPKRLSNSIKGNYPVTFREDELNAWLSRRIKAKQGGLANIYIKNSHIWVNLKKNDMEVVIEREIPNEQSHVTILKLKFESYDRGYTIHPYSAHIGHVNAPGGFARLITSPYKLLADELFEDLAPYHDRQIRNITVEDGRITISPRSVTSS